MTLILGAGGYLGRHLTHYLGTYTDDRIYGVDKDVVDLKDLDDCKRLFDHIQCDKIYQLAADSGNMEYLLSDDYSYGNSTLININIIKALNMIEYKGKILFPSTFYAADSDFIDNRYGLEKLYNETLYEASGLDVRIPRLFSVYGPGEKLNSSGEKVTTAFCRRIIEKEDKDTIKIIGHPKQSRYFLHVSDAIEGLIAHMQSDITRCDLAGKDAISLEQLIRMVIEISGKDIRVLWDNTWKQGDGWKVYYPASCSLEWQPMTGFGYGINELYGWVENELHKKR